MKSKWFLVLAATMTVGCEPAPAPKADKPPTGGAATAKEGAAELAVKPPKSEAAAPEKVLSPLEQILELSNSFSSDQEKWIASMKAAKPADRPALAKTRPDAKGIADKIKAIAEGNDNPEIRFESLMFTAKNLRDEPAAIELVKNHSANDKVAQVVLTLAGSKNPDAKSALEALATGEGNSPAKGAALFSLAMQLEEDEPARAEQYLETISTDFSAVDIGGRKLGEMAAPMLFALKNLGIGKVAPDIEGTDLDSVAFKLSDYRGKVVVLDFWGDW